jgi:hypothetical protein
MKPVVININIERLADKIESCKSGKSSDVEKTLNRILKKAIQPSTHQNKVLSTQYEIDFLTAVHRLEVHLIRNESLEISESYLKDLSLMKEVFLGVIHSNKRLERKCTLIDKELKESGSDSKFSWEYHLSQLKTEFQF